MLSIDVDHGSRAPVLTYTRKPKLFISRGKFILAGDGGYDEEHWHTRTHTAGEIMIALSVYAKRDTPFRTSWGAVRYYPILDLFACIFD